MKKKLTPKQKNLPRRVTLFYMFANLFSGWCNRRQLVSTSTSVLSCTITHPIASGKFHCTQIKE